MQFFIPTFILAALFIVVISGDRKKKKAALTRILKNKKGDFQMQELAKMFIGKKCSVSTIEESYTGVITDVTDSAVLLDDKVIVNLDFIVSVKDLTPIKKEKLR